jgi:hypothetical protein
MKTSKRSGFWLLFGFVVLVGFFFILNLVFRNQFLLISDVRAQMAGSNSGLYGVGGMAPQNVMFAFQGFSGTGYGRPYGLSFPGDSMFGHGLMAGTHPGSYIFQQRAFPGDAMFPGNVMFPGDLIIDGSDGKTKMRTILTCSGCALTMSTCDWDCGRTFSYCNTGTQYGSGFTGLTCPGPTGLICDGGSNTSIACTSGFCGDGGNTLMTCSGGIFCDWSEGNTSRTCDIFGCRASRTYPRVTISSTTCGGFLYAGCPGQWDGIYDRLMPYEPTPSPAF